MTALGRRIYLDHNASAPLLPEARDALVAALACVGNASSVHSEGRASRILVENARRQVGALVGVDADRVVFTSGASEAASTCLTPEWTVSGQAVRLQRLAVLDTDHPCIRDGGRFDTASVTRLPVDRQGIVDFETLHAWVGQGEGGLLALTVANSETGVIQPIRAIVEAVRTSGAMVVLDVVQLAGRVPVNMEELGADALILSGHKFGAPKGIGAFVLGSTACRPAPLVIGGAQETRQRAGTEAVPMIAAFGAAASVAAARLGHTDGLLRLRSRIEDGLAAIHPGLMILGQGAERLPQTVALHHPVLKAETVQIALDLEGFAVSAGSACSSGKLGPSHVLQALARAGAPVDPEAGTVRVSFGLETDEAEIDLFLAVFRRHWSRVEGKLAELEAA